MPKYAAVKLHEGSKVVVLLGMFRSFSAAVVFVEEYMDDAGAVNIWQYKDLDYLEIDAKEPDDSLTSYAIMAEDDYDNLRGL